MLFYSSRVLYKISIIHTVYLLVDLKDSTGANEVAYGGRPRGHNQSDEDETLPERELVHVNAILE